MKKLIPILAILMFVAVSQAQTIVSYPYVGSGNGGLCNWRSYDRD